MADEEGMQNPIFRIMQTPNIEEMDKDNPFFSYGSNKITDSKIIQNIIMEQGLKIINHLYNTKNGELLLISGKINRNEESLYFLHIIDIKSEKEKKQIETEIDILEKIDSKYILKIINHKFFHEEEKDFVLIILNYYENNLFKIIHETNFLNSRNIWKIFVQIILGINSLNLYNILPVNLIPQNIYIDNENNIKIGGINMVLDIVNKDIQEPLLLPYYSPEIIKGEKIDEKSILWSIGSILYELVFRKPIFWGKNIEDIKDNILKINYKLPEDCENELSFVLKKLICEKGKRLTIKELIFDEIFKKKILEVNLFSEIIKYNAQDFNNYFSLNVGLFDEKDAINKFRFIELNEYPFYLICKKCYNNPKIELKDYESILISCSKCNINTIERIENIVNYSSKYVSNAIKFCDSKHEEITPSNIYCKTHNLFFCQECFNKHKNEVPIGDDIVKLIFQASSGFKIELNVSKKTPLNEVLKIYMKNIGYEENLMDVDMYFLFSGGLLDINSQKTIEELKMVNNDHIIVENNGNNINPISYEEESFWVQNHNFIRFYKLKKNICIFHNKDFILNCIQCNMKICDECKNNHNNHLIHEIDNKSIFLQKEYMEFENFIINNENKKREILKKVQENIIWFENYKSINKDEFNNIVKKLLSKFYKDLENAQNLLFFSKILFDSFIRKGKEEEIKNQYKNIINLISQFFNEKKIKEYDLNNFQIINEYKDECKCVYESSFNFIPQIKLKFNDVKEIDKEIIDSLKEKLKEIFKEKDVKIIEIRKGSLSACIALNYLIKEKLENTNMENKNFNEIIKELNEYLGLETKNIKDILKNNLNIVQKDKQFKPDLATEKIYDLETPDELVKCIAKTKKSKDDINIYEISKTITGDEIKNFFDSLYEKTKETQDNIYDDLLNSVNNEFEDYLQIFDVKFEEALKKSIFEYNTKYIAYIYRYDENYNSGLLRCGNIEKKILFHGTNSIAISKIFAGHFKDSKCHIFGPGIYFSDLLDYTWYYADDSGEIGCRDNFCRIPEIKETFSFIVANVYYDKNKFEQVYNNDKANIEVPEFGIRHILVDYRSAAIPKNQLDNYSKFKGTEYLITNRNQILPLLSVTVERVKYLIVWRDNNFNDSNPNGYSEFEKMLEFNREIENFASLNLNTKIYYFNESEEALEFIKRKKYNKIILITNGGNDGPSFINNARRIIGNNTIALITCYVANKYLKIVQNMENVLLNSPFCNCMKKFLNIVCKENLKEIKDFQKEIEKKYQELDNSFNFKKINENAFKFPKFKESGKFEDLDFKDDFNDQNNDSSCIVL